MKRLDAIALAIQNGVPYIAQIGHHFYPITEIMWSTHEAYLDGLSDEPHLESDGVVSLDDIEKTHRIVMDLKEVDIL